MPLSPLLGMAPLPSQTGEGLGTRVLRTGQLQTLEREEKPSRWLALPPTPLPGDTPVGVTWSPNRAPPGLSTRVLVFLFQSAQWEELFLSRPGLSHQDEPH